LHAGSLAHHLQRDPLGAVRNFWDYRGPTPPPKVLVKIGIERHGPKASGTGQGPPICRGRPPARRALGSPPSTRPARCCTQLLRLPRIDAFVLGTNQDWDRATRATGERNRSRSANLSRGPVARRVLASPPSTRPARCCTNFWDYRGLTPPSKVLVKIEIERHGPKASGTGQGPPIYPGRPPARRALGSPP
jgi:hypothetical protein